MNAAIRRALGHVATNYWGTPEPTSIQEQFADDVANHAGCPDLDCPELTICDPCGQPVCTDHTLDVTWCANIGAYHELCLSECTECAAAMAQDHAEDRFERLMNEGW